MNSGIKSTDDLGVDDNRDDNRRRSKDVCRSKQICRSKQQIRSPRAFVAGSAKSITVACIFQVQIAWNVSLQYRRRDYLVAVARSYITIGNR